MLDLLLVSSSFKPSKRTPILRRVPLEFINSCYGLAVLYSPCPISSFAPLSFCSRRGERYVPGYRMIRKGQLVRIYWTHKKGLYFPGTSDLSHRKGAHILRTLQVIYNCRINRTVVLINGFCYLRLRPPLQRRESGWLVSCRLPAKSEFCVVDSSQEMFGFS